MISPSVKRSIPVVPPENQVSACSLAQKLASKQEANEKQVEEVLLLVSTCHEFSVDLVIINQYGDVAGLFF